MNIGTVLIDTANLGGLTRRIMIFHQWIVHVRVFLLHGESFGLLMYFDLARRWFNIYRIIYNNRWKYIKTGISSRLTIFLGTILKIKKIHLFGIEVILMGLDSDWVFFMRAYTFFGISKLWQCLLRHAKSFRESLRLVSFTPFYVIISDDRLALLIFYPSQSSPLHPPSVVKNCTKILKKLTFMKH